MIAQAVHYFESRAFAQIIHVGLVVSERRCASANYPGRLDQVTDKPRLAVVDSQAV